ncbi:conserved membrane hypothetical protein [Candidatus Roizmanbacteria bacterium]|nr:conserved membrane hypothetical protein [Candidatus Roizmanbacteria bacterium]
MKYLATPKLQLALILLAIILFHLISNFSLYLLVYFVITISLTVFVDYLFIWSRKIKPFLLSGAVVTGSIISLLYSPKNSFLELFIIIVLAIASKHFIKYKGRHIFNPAVFGLFLGSLIFKIPVAWWGVSSNSWLISILLFSTAYVSIFRSRKIFAILSFLIIYNIGTFFLNGYVNPLDPVIVFFSLVMLPEPMTSPNNRLKQIYFGTVTAVMLIFLSRIIFIPEVLLGSLLLSNLVFLKNSS